MPNYQNGKIYKIVNDIDDQIYIGSTCQKLCKRMVGHRSTCNDIKEQNRKLYQLMHHYGVEHFRIELIKEFPCGNKEQLTAEEGKHIRELKSSLNSKIDGRTKKEWNEDNKERLKERRKEYYQANQDRIKEQMKKYREDNKERMNKYRDDNKERIKEQMKKYYEDNKEQMKKYYENNKEIINERMNKYRDDNKERIKEQMKKYYEDNKERIKERKKEQMKKYYEAIERQDDYM
jgi:hypothetical protein